MKGKVLANIVGIQRAHCAVAHCMMNGDNWMHHFISHILHMTYLRWALKSITLNDSIRGTLRLQKHEEVIWEVKTLLKTDPFDVLVESKFLLEFEFNLLCQSSFEQQTYWV